MKKEKAITLIALVITIIILLILAGISIATLIGQNGLLSKANTAKEEHKIAQYKEELNLIIAEEIAERKTEVKEEPMIVSLEGKIREKDWVNQEKVKQYNEEGITESDPAKNKYLIVESKERYEFIIEVDNEKETAKIKEANKTPGEKYTITYDPNGGIGEARTVEVRKGFYKKLEENTFTKTDYIFGGWCEKPEIDGETIIYPEGSKYKAEGDVTLYAVWTYNVATISFNNNTGTGEMESKKVPKGETAKLPVNTFTKEDYEFVKWNTKADGTGKDYEESGSITPNEDITLYAIWKEKVSVKSSIKNQTVFEENTPIPDEYGNEITVPKGFKIVEGTDVTKGVVIEDVSAGTTTTKGSQFVWIPVGEVKYEGGTKIIELNRYTFSKDQTPTKQGMNAIDTYYQELATSNYGNTTAKDIAAFQPGGIVSKTGGYYIGRYEAGDPDVKTDRTKTSGVNSPIVCKENQFVYNFVTQPETVTLANNMYTNKKITSDLVNSYAWDTALVFIQEFSGDINYASTQGRVQTSIAKTGKAERTNTEIKKDVRCNIYDMAGNCWEWTSETYARAGRNPCVHRGGVFSSSSNSVPGTRDYTKGARDDTSFRVVLYL